MGHGFHGGARCIHGLRIYSWLTEGIEAFDWDPAKVVHILRHAVTPFGVEEVVSRPQVWAQGLSIGLLSLRKFFQIRMQLDFAARHPQLPLPRSIASLAYHHGMVAWAQLDH